jgi:HlyD family secretion protein
MIHRCLLMTSLLLVALAGCAHAAAQTPPPTPVAAQTAATPAAVGLRPAGSPVVASGEVVPAREAHLAFTTVGRVQTVTVAEGDPAQPGRTLTTLETPLLEAGVAQAEAALAAAQAQQALLEAGPRPAAVAAAQAQVDAAEATLDQATAQRDQLTCGAADAEIAAARAQLAAAQAEEKATREAYHQVREQKAADWKQEAALLRLRAAEQRLVAAEAQLALTQKGTRVRFHAAQAAVQAATAQRDAAQAQLDLLQAGATGEEIAAAEAAVAQAEAALAAAQAALDQATLRAPFAGTVAALEVSAGETVLPGQVVLTLADLDHLRAETTDLSEMDVGQVAVGQRATVYVEALGLEIGGRVLSIEPRAGTIGGDVVYKVVIELDEQPPGLRWGMSVDVEIATR